LAPLLDIQDLRTEIRLRRATVYAIDGVSLTVAPGECLGIVGESGSGKTMTALSIMRLLPGGGEVVNGRIFVDGTDVAALSEEGMEDVRGNLIGMIFQDPLTSLNPTMSIGDQIAESVRLHRGASKAVALERAVEVLGLVGMPRPAERVAQYPHQLSGGMRQRVMIAMALANEPKLLIADEPTTALDVTIQKQILELIDSLRRRLGMSVILVTHDLGVIAGTADRVAVMYAGRIVETGTTATLFANPRHPYTEALFEALPERAAVVTEGGPAGGRAGRRLYNIPGQPPDLTAPPHGCKFAPRCRYAREECRESEPELTDMDGTHAYRCFFPVGRNVDLPATARDLEGLQSVGDSHDQSIGIQERNPQGSPGLIQKARGSDGGLGGYFRRRVSGRSAEISPTAPASAEAGDVLGDGGNDAESSLRNGSAAAGHGAAVGASGPAGTEQDETLNGSDGSAAADVSETEAGPAGVGGTGAGGTAAGGTAAGGTGAGRNGAAGGAVPADGAASAGGTASAGGVAGGGADRGDSGALRSESTVAAATGAGVAEVGAAGAAAAGNGAVRGGGDSPGDTVLVVSHLVKNFTVTAGAVLQRRVGEVSAVADVSFEIPTGSTFGMVGESGCGKTTVGRLIVGLEKPSAGSIVLAGRDLASLPWRERRRQARLVQMMFQDSYASMDPRMRVGTILREPMIIQRDGNRASQTKRVSAMLDEVGLPAAAAERYPHEFSGGQRQRLGLARALMLRPSMIVADEPVSALDVSIQAQILNLMLDLQREHGLTYLFISHDLSVVRYMADVIGVMYLGKLVEVGPADSVYSSPVHPYTRGLIDTVPVADPVLERAKENQGVRGELPSAVAPPSGCRFRTRCPRAQDLCAAEEPPLRPFTADGHLAACHFPLYEPDPSI
jgi:peptide/nickel transport system ATP-binding protein